VLRHPVYGKGQVRLRLCAPEGDAGDVRGRAAPWVGEVIVSKRHGERYRAARDLAWGDAWPPDAGQDPTDRSDFRVFSES
jgi:ribosomal protein RSM22 (predicted rRNA methylase)